MPKVIEGQSGLKGSFSVIPFEIADDLITSDNRNPQLNVRFHVEGDKETIVKLGVDIEDANEAFKALQPCCPGLTRDAVEADETKLRILIGGSLSTEPRMAYVRSNFIQNFSAPVGVHKGKFDSIYPAGQNSYGQDRVGIALRTEEGLQSSILCPWGPRADGKGAAVYTRVGATPAEDEIEFYQGKYVWKYLVTLGLNWERFMEWLNNAPALYTQTGLDGEIPGLFADHKNITPELTAFMHNLKLNGPLTTVKWEVVDTGKGLWPKKNADHEVMFTVIESDDAGFNHELGLFLTRWDQLTQKLTGDENARFVSAGKLTEQSRPIAKSVLKPVIEAYPDAVKSLRDDGSPIIKVPPTPDTWEINGLVCATNLAARLVGSEHCEEIAGDQEQLLAWVNLEIPEFQDDLKFVEEKGEEL